MKIITVYGTIELEEGWRKLLMSDIDGFDFDLPKLREALEKNVDVELDEEESEKFLSMVELLSLIWRAVSRRGYQGGMNRALR